MASRRVINNRLCSNPTLAWCRATYERHSGPDKHRRHPLSQQTGGLMSFSSGVSLGGAAELLLMMWSCYVVVQRSQWTVFEACVGLQLPLLEGMLWLSEPNRSCCSHLIWVHVCRKWVIVFQCFYILDTCLKLHDQLKSAARGQQRLTMYICAQWKIL